MFKIGLITDKYQISHRTLHYWEKAGILKSIRGDNGYRYYDDANEKRINQILILKKLELKIRDIERIFLSNDINVAIEILKEHLENIIHKVETTKLLSETLKHLIYLLENENNFQNMFYILDESTSNILKNENPSSNQMMEVLSMDDDFTKEKEMRIINLPRMTVASLSKAGDNPEESCWQDMFELIKENNLDKEPGFRNFGYGYNDVNGDYIYELWITIPSNFIVDSPFLKKEFPGGLYAALPTYLTNIGETWQELHDLVTKSGNYEHDTDLKRDMYLEECLDIQKFHAKDTKLSEKQLDLLLPIKQVEAKIKSMNDIMKFDSNEVILPDLLLGGTYFVLREAVRPWKKSVPWYQLAQNIYKVGNNINDYMNHGNNTFTLVYGTTINAMPFYLDVNKGKVQKVFAAVELVKPFPIYPLGLEELTLLSKKYRMFSMGIHPSDAKSIKLNFKTLYEEAADYFKDKLGGLNETYCIEREYRADGRYVDRIELYIELKG